MTTEEKLQNIVNSGKPKSITVQGKKYYLSKAKINELKEKSKEGGFLPLLALLPLIFGGIAAAGAVAGGTAAVVKTVNDTQHNIAVENILKDHPQPAQGQGMKGKLLKPYAKGNGFKDEISDFIKTTKLDEDGKKILGKTLQYISNRIGIVKTGEGLFLTNYTN
jgi:hypothetical protein